MTFLKDDIAIAVKRELNEAMTTYGYDIINTFELQILIQIFKLKMQ